MIIKRKIRYVLVEASDQLEIKKHFDELSEKLLGFLGEGGFSYLNLKLMMQYNQKMFSLRVNRDQERHLILALSFVKELGGKKIGFYTLRTSGTMKTLYEYAKKNAS